MKFPFFATFILFGLWITYRTKHSTSEFQKKEDEFRLRERKANIARKQPLDNLTFIHIPFDKLKQDSLQVPEQQEQLQELHSQMHALEEKGIVNFTGQTNTDLKLAYGFANLETLMAYDDHYASLLICLNQIGQLYHDNGNNKAALSYLEYAVSLHTDISTTYSLLSTIYQEEGNPRKIEHLLPIAEDLNSGMKQKIVSQLKEALS